MATIDYTLEWLLPYARRGMKGMSNFEYRNYADAVLKGLHAANGRCCMDRLEDQLL